MATSTGSDALDRMVERLGGTADPKRRYEYVLWLAKKLAPMPAEEQTDDIKVRGCVSQVFVRGALDCLLYTSPSPRDLSTSRMPSSA